MENEIIKYATETLGGRCEIVECNELPMKCKTPNYKIIICTVSKKKVLDNENDDKISIIFRNAFKHKTKQNIKEVEGCTVFTKRILEKHNTILVFVNSDLTKLEQDCITLHELGHIVNGDHLHVNPRDFRMEIRADIYAAEAMGVTPTDIGYIAIRGSIDRYHSDMSESDKLDLLDKRMSVYRKWLNKVKKEETREKETKTEKMEING